MSRMTGSIKRRPVVRSQVVNSPRAADERQARATPYSAGDRIRTEEWKGMYGDAIPPPWAGTPPVAPPSGGGGGGRRYGYGGGGYGGGGGGGNAANGALVSSLKALLGTTAFDARNRDGDRKQIDGAVTADRDRSRGVFDELAASLPTTSAYDGMQAAQAAQIDPALLQLLAVNGGDTAAYQAEIEMANASNAQGTAASQRLIDQMRAAAQQSNESRRVETGMAGRYQDDVLQAEGRGLRAQLAAAERADQERKDAERMQVLMQLIAAQAQTGASITDFEGLLR